MSNHSEQLVVKMGMDTSTFKKSLRTVKADVESFKHGLKELALAGGLIGLWEGFEKLRESIQHVKETSEGFGVTTDFVQGLGMAAKKAGLDAETGEKGFEHFFAKIAEARESSGEARDLFLRMGVSIDDLKSKGGEELFFQFADKLHDTADGGERARLAIEAMGKAGLAMVPILAEGGEKLKAFIDLKKSEGKIISKEDIDNIVEFNRQIRALSGGALPKLAAGFSYVIDKIRFAAMYYGVLSDMLFGNRNTGKMTNAQFAINAAIESEKELKDALKGEEEAKNRIARIDSSDKAVSSAVTKQSQLTSEFLEQIELHKKKAELEKKYSLVLADNAAKIHFLKSKEDEIAAAIKQSTDGSVLRETLLQDLKKAQLETNKELNEQEREKVELQQKQVDASKRLAELKAELAQEKGDVTKFSLTELANANNFNLSDEAFKEKLKAQEALNLEKKAQAEKGFDPKQAQADYQKSLDIRQGLSFLKSGEKDPYAALEKQIAESSKVNGELLKQAKAEGLNVRLVAAVNQPPK